MHRVCEPMQPMHEANSKSSRVLRVSLHMTVQNTLRIPCSHMEYSVLFQGTIAKQVIGKADRHVIVSTSCIERT